MNVAVLKQELATKKAAIETLLGTQMATAEKEQRQRTAEEVAEVERLITEGRALKERVDQAQLDDVTRAAIRDLMPVTAATPTGLAVSPRSLGAQFVGSDAFDFLRQGGHRTRSAWTSPSVELFETTLTEDPTSGGKLIIPDYRPGIVPLLFKRLVVADLIAQGTTVSNLVVYMKETLFTNAAATVLEGAAKPESALAFDQASDPVRKIAHFLPVTEEMLEDAPAIASYIDARLRLGIGLTEENQLLNGTVTAPDIIGILNRTGLSPAWPRGTDSNIDAVFKQISYIASNVFVQPSGICMNPANWQTVQLTKTAMGTYMGTGPFMGPQAPTLWGVPVAVTPTIAAGTALVGDFAGSAQIFRRGGLRVEASNSHQDFFIKNLVAIRAEERLALCVYRPAAFGTVTGLN